MPKFDLAQAVRNYELKPVSVNGETLTEDGFLVGIDGKPTEVAREKMTYRELLSAALNNSGGEGEILTPEQRSKIFRLSELIWRKKKVDITTPDNAFIQDRAGVTLTNPLLFGRLTEFLEGKSPEDFNEESDESSEDAPAAPTKPKSNSQARREKAMAER